MNKHILILENIRSAYNVGTMIRTADALGWNIICSGYTPTPFSEEKVLKSSLGAEQHVNIHQFRSTIEAIQFAKDTGYFLVAGEIADNSVSLDEFEVTMDYPIALVVGSETDGVLQETLALADRIVHIPMRGYKESLNVAEAASIIMWELGKRAA